jgi:hypothetical protein
LRYEYEIYLVFWDMIWSVLLPTAVEILSYVFMPVAVGDLSYANCVWEKWHVELFMFYE